MGAALALTHACSSGHNPTPARPRLTLVASTPADQVAPSSDRIGHLQLVVAELARTPQQIAPERHLRLVPDSPDFAKLETLSSGFEGLGNQQPCGFDGPEIPVIEYSYDDYGAQIATPGGDPYNPYRFQSQPLDEESGLYYLQARYYNPGLGKFIQADPLRYGAGLNLYDYCNNDPINHSDPSGLDPSLVALAIEGIGAPGRAESYGLAVDMNSSQKSIFQTALDLLSSASSSWFPTVRGLQAAYTQGKVDVAPQDGAFASTITDVRGHGEITFDPSTFQSIPASDEGGDNFYAIAVVASTNAHEYKHFSVDAPEDPAYNAERHLQVDLMSTIEAWHASFGGDQDPMMHSLIRVQDQIDAGQQGAQEEAAGQQP
jgi:RHS repeat-associated protein